jgi:hypothetical protein
MRASAALPVVQVLPDGSYLSAVHAEPDRRSRRNPVVVRVVEHTLARGGDATVHRPLTTLLDPEQASARAPAALYVRRWEIETTLDEIKTHQRGPKLVPRSQLMHRAATGQGLDPDRLSFTWSLRIVRRQVPDQAAFSPGRLARTPTRTLAEIAERLLPARRHRTCPRVIRRKMSNWPLKTGRAPQLDTTRTRHGHHHPAEQNLRKSPALRLSGLSRTRCGASGRTRCRRPRRGRPRR